MAHWKSTIWDKSTVKCCILQLEQQWNFKRAFVNKFNMTLENLDRIVLNDQSIALPQKEPQGTLGFVQKHPLEVFCERVVLKNFTNFTGEYLCWSLFLIMLQVFRPATLLKRDSNIAVFLWNLQNFSEQPTLKNICQKLLLFVLASLD